LQPTLSDGVVLLDRHTDADLDAHLAGEDEEQARRFGWYPARSTAQGVRRAFNGWADDWTSNGETRTFALRDASSRVLAGGVQVRQRERSVGRLSYWMFPSFRGRGFATRGVRLVSAWAFAELSVTRLELLIEPDNEPSRRVARAAGFVEEGILRRHERIGETFRDMILYSLEPATA
jgi:RimJ/RimL family protein N-acetyltransferase